MTAEQKLVAPDGCEWTEVPHPSIALIVSSRHCEGACGRLVFTTVRRRTNQPVMVELAGDDDATYPWTYPVHTAGRCRYLRGLQCCDLHTEPTCCDGNDCGPCCGGCPTCPTLNRMRDAGIPIAPDLLGSR